MILWQEYRDLVIPAFMGMLVGWSMVQLVKMARRDQGKPKLSNTRHRLIAMLCATLGSLIASTLTGLDNPQTLAVSFLAGLLCPTFWGLALKLTCGKTGWMGQVHWYLRGNRRICLDKYQNKQRRSTDPDDTWY